MIILNVILFCILVAEISSRAHFQIPRHIWHQACGPPTVGFRTRSLACIYISLVWKVLGLSEARLTQRWCGRWCYADIYQLGRRSIDVLTCICVYLDRRGLQQIVSRTLIRVQSLLVGRHE